MPKSKLPVLNIEDLKLGMFGITPRLGGFLAENCAVCLDNQNHSTGKEFEVLGDLKNKYLLTWTPVTVQMQRSYHDLEEATENGACGLAILIMSSMTEFNVLERSRKGTGFDYWLGAKPTPYFQDKRRLEVSGILRGGLGDINSRMKIKLEQIAVTDNSGIPAFVIIVEFGKPVSLVKEK
jgi:hypothetical protein